MSTETAQVCFGEVPVKAEFSSNRATPDELVKLANRIWREVQSENIPLKETERIDAYLKKLQEQHKDFQVSFPMVLRWMVQRNEYSAQAFKKYLELHAYKPNASREVFLGLQADYLMILQRETNRKASEANLRAYRKAVLEALQKEDREFTEQHKQYSKEYDDEQREYNRQRRLELYKILMRQRAVSAAAEPATAEPAAAEPATAEPAAAEPATAEPATAEPATAEPATAEPAATEPIAE